MKNIGASVGGLVVRMNERYVGKEMPAYFDAQDFLWKHPDTDRLVREAFARRGEQALQELQTARRNLFRSVFSDCRSAAHLQIWRMFGRDFTNAMRLRLDYDVEFSAGLLDNDPLSDIAQLESLIPACVFPRAVVEKKMADARYCPADHRRLPPKAEKP